MNTMKKIYLWIGLTLVVMALIFFYFRAEFSQNKKVTLTEKQDSGLIDPVYIESKKILYTDTDGDGVYDWEENLYPELDANNSDSDGDGVSDYYYLIRKKQDLQNETVPLEDRVKYTASEELGRGLFSALSLVVNSEDGSLNDEDRLKISQNVEKHISELDILEKHYLSSDLNVVGVSNEENLKYKKEITALWKKYPVPVEEIRQLWKASEDPKLYLYQTSTILSKYEKYEKELQGIDVPRIVVARHLDLLNFVANIHAASKNLQNSEVDDVIAIAFLFKLEDLTLRAQESVIKINKFFELAEI